MFVLRLDPGGNYLWSQLASDDGWGPSLAIDPAGYVLLAGGFEGSIDLGGGLLTSAADYDVFVAKLAP